ncbi:hypothetical protein [Paraburkholderia fungorum]|uniref:hypothetical protein n=1 Tax=Paraburkholderia fungorum TaxID=134537 RepID=UPI0038BDD0E5
MDDRFDRRELLLHLGDMLGALNCLAKTSEPGASVAQLMQKNASMQGFEFLHALAPKMTVNEFAARVAGAFSLWPSELLETKLNRDALASTVQQNLFDGNPDGWNAYISHVQKKVTWFGTRLLNVQKDALAKPSHDAINEASPVAAVSSVDANARNEKRGWPWPEPKSKA